MDKKISVSQRIKNIFITGIFTSLPIVVTIYLVYFLYNLVTAKASPLVKKIALKYDFGLAEYEYTVQFVTFLLIIVVIFIIGFIAKLYFGRVLIKIMDKIIAGIPIASSIYNATKQVIDSFGSTSGSSFSKVVLIEFPRRDMWMLAFVVKEPHDFMVDLSTKEESYTVFVPTSPNPTSGFTSIVAKKDVKELDISVEDGIKYILSIGIINFNNDKDAESAAKGM